MDKIYFGTKDGDLLYDYEIRHIAFILSGEDIPYGDKEKIREFAKTCKGIKEEIKKPLVEYLVNHGHKAKATMIYKEKNPGISVKEAKDIIDAMEEKLRNKGEG